MLLLPEGQTGKAWEPSKKPSFVRNRGEMSRKGLPKFKGLNTAGQQRNALLRIAFPYFYQSLYLQKVQLVTVSDFPYIYIKTRPCENKQFSENKLWINP
jgi:hypothetical protein